MPSYERELARIEAIIQDIRAIRDRTCEPRNQSNPRYHGLSMAVSGLNRAAEDMRTDR